MESLQIARAVVGLSWIYHGIFPKLLQVAPMESAMNISFGFSDEMSYLVTKTAGVAEVIFGLVFIALYRVKSVVYLNIVGLSILLLLVAVKMPSLLIDAFNPVTTNISLIALSLVILNDQKKRAEKQSELSAVR